MTVSVYLASVSPRRQALLRQIGIDFRVLGVEVDETPLAGEQPEDYVIRLALAKAEAGREAALKLAPAPVLAADTAVTIDGEILGKPQDQAQALEMMARLSGRSHSVFTAVVLLDNAPTSRVSLSQVTFRQVSRAEALRYWRSGEPADKAGGYAIQGLAAAFISRLEGSYTGVMGLPLFETADLLAESGIELTWPRIENEETII